MKLIILSFIFILFTVGLFTVPQVYATLLIEGDNGGGNARGGSFTGCTDYGTWNESTKTCTLTKDIDDFVVILNHIYDYNNDERVDFINGMTLDGNGHKIMIPPDRCFTDPGGSRYFQYGTILSVQAKDVTIKNLEIIGQEVKCQFEGKGGLFTAISVGVGGHIDNVKISGLLSGGINMNNGVVENSVIQDVTGVGIGLSLGTIKNNEIFNLKSSGLVREIDTLTVVEDRGIGISAGGSSSNQGINIFGNNIHHNDIGVVLSDYYTVRQIVFSNNMVYDNAVGIISEAIHYQNSFIDNEIDLGKYSSELGRNGIGIWYDDEKGGNYWNSYDSHEEGCIDETHDNICDEPYSEINDQKPWNIQNIWRTSIETDGNITKEATSEKTNVSYTANASNSGQSISVNCSPHSGFGFPIGETKVICETNNHRQTSFLVTVEDTIPPSITVPSNMEVDAIDAHGAPVNFDDVVVSDKVHVSESSCTMYSGNLFPIGDNIVECTATDTSGNISVESFTISVVSDVPPPVIDIPKDIVLQANSQKGAYVTFPTITATDPLGILEQPTCIPKSNSFFTVGTTIVECKAKNMQEYVGTQTFSVTVEPPHSFTRELLPSREYIGTEWKFPTNKQVYNELSDRGSIPENYSGFAEFTWYGYMKGGGYDSNFLDLYIYRFDAKNNADVFYSDHVNYWYDRGGYSEWKPSWNSVSADECYGRATSGMYTDKISLYCIKDNIVTFVTTTGYEYVMKDELSNFADGVFDNMSKVNISTSKTESNPMCGEGTVFENGQCVIENNEEGGGCLIATATYGSEMATEVQQLRELRDNTLLNTESGTSFMKSFNNVYYSFSPVIADYERENPYFKEAVKIAITPLISSLSILNYVDMDSNESVLVYGMSLIILNLGMYLGTPIAIVIGVRKYSHTVQD
jgi:hypothetical protein